jgi:hypothetical protein
MAFPSFKNTTKGLDMQPLCLYHLHNGRSVDSHSGYSKWTGKVFSLFPSRSILKGEIMTTWAEEEKVNSYSGIVDSSVIFDAPDYASLLKHSSSAAAKEYEAKLNAMVKAGVVSALRSGNQADAATLLHFGPSLTQSIADLTDVSDKTKKMIDIITAPESPLVAVIATAIPMFMQFARNHEKEIEVARISRKDMRRAKAEAKARGEVPEKENRGVTIKLPFGRKVRIPISVKLHLISNANSIFRSQTYEPSDLTEKVFGDPKVIAALKKHRIVSL